MRILVAEDDDAVADSLTHALRREGHTVDRVGDGLTALDAVATARPDLIVLDVLMPGLDGLQVCRRLRGRNDGTPVLMLTARDLVDDRVAGLDAGADDYLVKPFALAEFRARVRALLRRSGAGDDRVSFADVELDPAAAIAWRSGDQLPLTPIEFALLEMFLRRTGRVLSRDVISETVWGYRFDSSATSLWVHISSLRAKLETNDKSRLIQTVRGIGYVMRESP
jgi:two-component system, OmpR family, response regulator MprA